MDVSGRQYAYTAAITALAQASNQSLRSQAIKLLDEMDDKGIPPNTYAFTAAFLAVDGGKPALELLKRAKRHAKTVEIGVHLYNSAIHACSRNGVDGRNGWQTALSLFRQMPRDGVQANEQTYASLLHACARSGQLKVALSVFDEMKNTSGIPPKSANKVWGAALRACATAGNGKKAMELMGEMVKSGIGANTLHYNSVLAALAKEGDDILALELLDQMQAGTVQQLFLGDEEPHAIVSGTKDDDAMPDLVSINTVLSAFVKAENYNGAKDFFERVKCGEFMYVRGDQHAVIRPDIISYNSLLSACRDPEEAASIINEVSRASDNLMSIHFNACSDLTNIFYRFVYLV